MKRSVFIIGLCLLPLAALAIEPPSGWRFPCESDYSGAWKAYQYNQSKPFHVEGDFNRDGLRDDAWILFSTESRSFGLFAFVSGKDGTYKSIRLSTNHHDNGPKVVPQSMGIRLAIPKEYITACGKGYRDCEQGEPEVLRLGMPSIDYYQFEGANSIFWWDNEAKTFNRTWISD